MSEIFVVIKEPLIDSREKLFKAIQKLSKAMKLHFKVSRSDVSEQSPYKSVREAEKRAEQEMDETLFSLFDSIRKQWLKSSLIKSVPNTDPFKLNKIVINPKTGKRLTRKEWQKIESSLDAVLKKLFKQQDDFITKRSIALGKILASMPVENRLDSPLSDIEEIFNLNKDYQDEYLNNVVNWAETNAAQYITDLTSRSRKNVMTTLTTAERNGLSSKEMEQQLFDRFSSMNRDWRRIAETEHAMNVNNALLTTELHNNKDKKLQLMQGVTMGNACSWCSSHIDGKVVALVDKPPEQGGDTVKVAGKEYKAIWPGKSNVGRSRNDWWVCAPAHPHCRCSFIPYEEGFDEYNKKLLDKIRGK